MKKLFITKDGVSIALTTSTRVFFVITSHSLLLSWLSLIPTLLMAALLINVSIKLIA
jgi:hypothetical protein